jgi:Zn-finger nucleic acid-binding protein
MTHLDVGATPLLECGTCDGIWIDADVFEALCATADANAQAAVLHRLAGRTAVAGDARVRYRPCVRCNTMMNRMNFGRLSGTIVDVCRGHGTFLDAGELHGIIAFIQDGGLDRTRQRHKDDLREQEQRTRDAQARASRERGRRDPHESVPADGSIWSAGTLKALLGALDK